MPDSLLFCLLVYTNHSVIFCQPHVCLPVCLCTRLLFYQQISHPLMWYPFSLVLTINFRAITYCSPPSSGKTSSFVGSKKLRTSSDSEILAGSLMRLCKRKQQYFQNVNTDLYIEVRGLTVPVGLQSEVFNL